MAGRRFAVAGYSNPESNPDAQASKEALNRVSEMKYLETFEQELSSWPDPSIHPHRFGGREFRVKAAEIGHVQPVDIPFPRSVRHALLTEGFAQEHRWVPNSGWIFKSETKQTSSAPFGSCGFNSIPGGLIHFLQHRREPHIPKPYLHAQCGIMRETIGRTWIDGKPKLG